eukprot:TRINITY_DN4959_c0_g1_i1.p1 TRINITY_DN4959_c0_g1~~TRINITY_DN4959_c0_g1_i1.p1  ORF type:complete len:247 (-),score=39.29 TRINITY_DN4959_c0_g1_i1:468-1208(-)
MGSHLKEFNMGIFYLLLLYGLLGGSCMYLILCVDPNKKGLLPWLHRLLYEKIPAVVKKYGTLLFGRRLMNGVEGAINWVCFRNNPLVQIFYLIVTVGGYIMYLYFGFSVHFPNNHLSNAHIYIALGIFAICIYSFYKTCAIQPGIITKKNEKEYLKRYRDEFDGILYLKDNECPTCKIIKYIQVLSLLITGHRAQSTAKFAMSALLDMTITAFGSSNVLASKITSTFCCLLELMLSSVSMVLCLES